MHHNLTCKIKTFKIDRLKGKSKSCKFMSRVWFFICINNIDFIKALIIRDMWWLFCMTWLNHLWNVNSLFYLSTMNEYKLLPHYHFFYIYHNLRFYFLYGIHLLLAKAYKQSVDTFFIIWTISWKLISTIRTTSIIITLIVND